MRGRGFIIVGMILQLLGFLYGATPREIPVGNFIVSTGENPKALKPIGVSRIVSDDQHDFWASATLKNAPPGIPISFAWYFLREEGTQVIYKASVKTDESQRVYSHISLDPPDHFPPGRYRVDLSIDGKVTRSLYFQLVKSTSSVKHRNHPQTPSASDFDPCPTPSRTDDIRLIMKVLAHKPKIKRKLSTLKLARYQLKKSRASMILPLGWARTKETADMIALEENDRNDYSALVVKSLPRDLIKSKLSKGHTIIDAALVKLMENALARHDQNSEKQSVVSIKPLVLPLGNYMAGTFEIEYRMKDGSSYRSETLLIDDLENLLAITILTTKRENLELLHFLGILAVYSYWSKALCIEKEKR